jgi:hypothetical protein
MKSGVAISRWRANHAACARCDRGVQTKALGVKLAVACGTAFCADQVWHNMERTGRRDALH